MQVFLLLPTEMLSSDLDLIISTKGQSFSDCVPKTSEEIKNAVKIYKQDPQKMNLLHFSLFSSVLVAPSFPFSCSSTGSAVV